MTGTAPSKTKPPLSFEAVMGDVINAIEDADDLRRRSAGIADEALRDRCAAAADELMACAREGLALARDLARHPSAPPVDLAVLDRLLDRLLDAEERRDGRQVPLLVRWHLRRELRNAR